MSVGGNVYTAKSPSMAHLGLPVCIEKQLLAQLEIRIQHSSLAYPVPGLNTDTKQCVGQHVLTCNS